jgi:hypothetical protein
MPRTTARTSSLLIGLALAALAVAGPALAGQLGPYEPATGCYIGAFVDLDHNVAGEIGDFERLTGKKHATYFRYVGYGQPFPYKWVLDLHSRQAVPHIAWEPNEGLGPVKDDDYLHGWAQAAARAGGPIFLRYASEMNGNWMAYSGDPDQYVAKWRLVYRIMHEEAPNVIMIWCPYATPRATIPLYYPGDEYVDWVGVNLYSVYHADGDPTKPASDDPRELLRYVYDLFAYRKPIAVCEYAATHYCVATKTPLVDFCLDNMKKLYTALATQFPRVRMINWFSVDTERNNLAHNNYSVTDNPQVLQAYSQFINSAHFLSTVPDEVALAARPNGAAAPVPVGPGEPVTPINPVVRPPVAGGAVATSVPLAGTRAGAVGATAVAVIVQGGSPGALTGLTEVLADVGRQLEADSVMFYVDGNFTAMTNVAPFRFTLNAANFAPGEHRLKIVVSNSSDRPIGTAEAAIVVAQ